MADRCELCAPTRTRSAAWPHVVRGGAPVWLSVPPWHVVHVVFQVAPWHWAQATAVEPPTPSRLVPWQAWQAESPAMADAAWKLVLVWSIQDAAWPFADFWPHGWQAPQVKPFCA